MKGKRTMTIKKTDLPELIVIGLFCVYVALSVLSSTALTNVVSVGSIMRVINLINLVFLTLNLVNLKTVSIKHLFILVLFFAIGTVVAMVSEKETQIFVPLLFIINGLFLRDGKLVRCYLYVVASICIITILLNIIGLYPNDALVENRGVRYYLGFTYTTYASNFFLHLYIGYISIKKKSISILETIAVLVINQILFMLTDTKAVYMLVYFSVLSLWIIRIFNKIPQSYLFKTAAYYSMPILSILIIILTVSYKQTYYYTKLDKILAGRIKLGNQGIKEYGFSLFGNATQWETGRQGIERSGDYFFVDSSYLNIMLTFGLIALAFIVIGFMILSIRAYQVKNYYLCFAIMLLAIHAFTDPQLFELRYNPLLLLLGPTLFGTVKRIIQPDNW